MLYPSVGEVEIGASESLLSSYFLLPDKLLVIERDPVSNSNVKSSWEMKPEFFLLPPHMSYTGASVHI